MNWLCKIGLHRWDYFSNWAYSEARECKRCHETQWWHSRCRSWISERISRDPWPGGTFTL